MLDTNVLVSLLLFPNPRMNAMTEYIFTEKATSFLADPPLHYFMLKFYRSVFTPQFL